MGILGYRCDYWNNLRAVFRFLNNIVNRILWRLLAFLDKPLALSIGHGCHFLCQFNTNKHFTLPMLHYGTDILFLHNVSQEGERGTILGRSLST